jgi:hypothetical protein
MRSISPEGMRALFAQDSGDIFVFAVKLSSSEWQQPEYFVGDNKDMVYQGITYKHLPFETSLPEQQDGILPSVELKICGIEREYTEVLRSLSSPLDADASVFRISSDGTAVLEIQPMVLTVSGFSYNDISVSLMLTLDADYLNEPATKDRFVPSTAPGLFA